MLARDHRNRDALLLNLKSPGVLFVSPMVCSSCLVRFPEYFFGSVPDYFSAELKIWHDGLMFESLHVSKTMSD
eukprot:4514593-Amphidinium_carterae.1